MHRNGAICETKNGELGSGIKEWENPEWEKLKSVKPGMLETQCHLL